MGTDSDWISTIKTYAGTLTSATSTNTTLFDCSHNGDSKRQRWGTGRRAYKGWVNCVRSLSCHGPASHFIIKLTVKSNYVGDVTIIRRTVYYSTFSLRNLISLIAQGYLDSVAHSIVALCLDNALICMFPRSLMLGVGSSFWRSKVHRVHPLL